MGLLRLQLIRAGSLILFAVALLAQDTSSSPAGSAAGSADRSAQTPVPQFRSVSDLVMVDVVVARDGRSVRGLPQQAFQVIEGGQEQALKAFEEHQISPEQKASLPANTYSNLADTANMDVVNILLLDALNTPLENQTYVRRQMIEYLKRIPPGTRIAIFTLASRLRLVQGFTGDVTSLQAALKSRKNGPRHSVLLDDRNALPGFAIDPAHDSAAAMDSIREFEADVAAFQTDMRVQITLDAFKQLARVLEGFPGRKNLIWVSGSFPVDLSPNPMANNPFWAQRGYSEQLQQVNDLLAAARMAVYPVDARGLIPMPGAAVTFSELADPESIPRGPSRMDSVGAAEVGPTRPGRPLSLITSQWQFARQIAAEHGAMRQIAEQTGGISFYDDNGIKQAVAKAVEDGSNFYTLAYSPVNKHMDGTFRTIEVKLAGGTYKLSYRRGYFADPPEIYRAKPPAANDIQTALGLTQIAFQARVVPADDPSAKVQLPPGKAGSLADKLKGPVQRYLIDYVADLHQVATALQDDGRRQATLEFVSAAYDADGKMLNFADQTFRLTMIPTKYDELLRTGWPLHQELDLPAGHFNLRLLIRDVTSERAGALTIPLTVAGSSQER